MNNNNEKRQLAIEDVLSKDNVIRTIRGDMKESNIEPTQDIIDGISKMCSMSKEKAEESFYVIAIETLKLLGRGTTLQAFAVYTSERLRVDMKKAYEVLDFLCDTDLLFDISDPKYEGSFYMIEPILVVSEETLHNVQLAQYLPPMVCQPRMWTDNSNGGFLTKRNSFVLGHPLNRDTDPLYYGTANNLQKVAYSLREEMLPFQTFVRNKQGYSPEKVTLRTQKIMLDNGNEFYFPYRVDYRGRHYSQGHFINLQGDEQQKSILQFAEKRMLTDRGEHWLGIAIANAVGYDHKTLQWRTNWFNKHMVRLLKNPEKYIATADESLTLRALLHDLRDHHAGKPVGTIMHVDATNSGLQIYSALYSCKITAELCNLYGTQRNSAYRILADKMSDKLGYYIEPKFIKKPLMVYYYSAGEDVIREELQSNFGVDYKEEILNMFYEEVEELAPAGTEGMNDIRASHDKRKTMHSWVLPDGFEVEALSIVTESVYTDTKEFGVQMHYKSVLRGSKRSTAMSPNVIHSIDGFVIRRLESIANIPLAPIHDSLGMHPNDVDTGRSAYKQVLCEINDSTLLSDILSQIEGEEVSIMKMNTLTNSMIKWATHPLS